MGIEILFFIFSCPFILDCWWVMKFLFWLELRFKFKIMSLFLRTSFLSNLCFSCNCSLSIFFLLSLILSGDLFYSLSIESSTLFWDSVITPLRLLTEKKLIKLLVVNIFFSFMTNKLFLESQTLSWFDEKFLKLDGEFEFLRTLYSLVVIKFTFLYFY